MESEPNAAGGREGWQRCIPLATWIVAVLAGLLIPLKILSLGYLPQDDALRHVAKVVSGKAWPEILVVGGQFHGDEHPGWHAILGAGRRWLKWDTDALLVFSVLALFVGFWLTLLATRQRPEAVLAALLVASVAAPATFVRPLFGRPFIFVMIVYLLLLHLWTRRERVTGLTWVGSAGLMAVSVWVHGSWYLFGLMIAGLALAGAWRRTVLFTGCWLVGVALGASFTGHPLSYLSQTLSHLFGVFGGQPLQRMMVTEMRPDAGDVVFALVVLLALVWRRARGEGEREVIRDAVFAVAVLGWLLGLKVSRFWTDWGFPAAILWLATELQATLEAHWKRASVRSLMLAVLAGGGVFFSTTRDLGNRWTSQLTVEYVTPETPGIAGWLPDRGGTVYSSDMNVFFRLFHANPHADWRYALGFEPGIMRPDDLEILRKIQWNWNAAKAYAPWVAKMRPEDRLILLQTGPPNIEGLEWYYAATETWIGRRPRQAGEIRATPAPRSNTEPQTHP